MQKTTFVKNEAALANKKWYVIDASNLILGKLAVEAANILRGKNKVDFTPNVDCGDYLIIINSDKIVLSSDKADREKWYTHSGYIGGLKEKSGRLMIEKYSDKLIYGAIKGMLPKNTLSRYLIKKLFIYKDANHKQAAQKPMEIKLN
ncbi:50S ribosomal protein L13 [Malacoplasma penetrans]|uniref:Large ribosomal subunit protein uL13 n=1 Tax=Malacoplasma penetrans (strain HF-2) TaxID=272633 RepID=RL13_MALP2|nr:50S ribosomal protein L13 [Malacoplasma penetrans]Q8EWW9.1 RecName: Full=Large ribosomal subunit protein uL13; AltName: Full=50S ribosomal protein L13 [Malacoplasma penetrans HF-2]RXY97341.1 50S ribosomal protein L13 [Malacoplasma penetrans]BAC43871.1 ribosomal protein L13 [Malacoplasma penetrans HF-2]